MERRAKERLIGALVLVMLAVIIIPLVLDDSIPQETTIDETNIPPRPEFEFASKIVPLPPAPPGKQERQAEGGSPATGREGRAPAAQSTATAPAPVEPAADGQEGAKAGGSDAGGADPGTGASTPAPVAGTGAAKQEAVVGMTAWVVQLGSFGSEENATALNDRLRKAGFASFTEPLKQGDGSVSWRVRVGPELRRSDAQTLRERISKSIGIDGIIVAYP